MNKVTVLFWDNAGQTFQVNLHFTCITTMQWQSDIDKFNVDLMFIVTDYLTQASFKTPNDFHITLEMNGNE